MVLIFGALFWGMHAFAQSNLKIVTIEIDSDTVILPHKYIVPGSFESDLDEEWFHVDVFTGGLTIHNDSAYGKHVVRYRIFPQELTEKHAFRDTSMILPNGVVAAKPLLAARLITNEDIFGSTLNKTGSISRGISFGNNQNLSVNSNLNLQMSGKIAPDISILASVTDDNIPIQPQGNTQQLQDFDQVYIKVFNAKKWELTAGDFWLDKPLGYFMTYRKRAQGGTFNTKIPLNETKKSPTISIQGSGAVSKGKFSRNIIQGIESNQGPYRLTGANNEPFIVVLSGTERVFIDGKLLIRGQQNDYVIDYNTSEVTFTPKNLITKDRRIVVEFQYSDQNYARSLFQASTVFESKKMKAWINVYSEQDAKNQPLQISLNEDQRNVLANAGDSISQAFASSIDTAEYADNRILYYLIDTITVNGVYTDVLFYTVQNDTDLYKASFTLVGENQGNYVLDQITALGRVYRWVEPLSGVPQGQYEPIILLTAPNQQQMVSAGAEWLFKKNSLLGFEGAFSNNDLNTFSPLDEGNDQGVALRPYFTSAFKLRDSSSLQLDAKAEYLSANYKAIERFRTVEFTRNWNVATLDLTGEQFLASGGLVYQKKAFGKLGYTFNTFINGNDYEGYKHDVSGALNKNGWKVSMAGSALNTSGLTNSNFIRHKSVVQKNIGKFKLIYNDEHEKNEYQDDGQSSYQFYDWQGTLATGDSSKNRYQIFYRQRYDRKPDTLDNLNAAALANQFGAEAKLRIGKSQTVTLNASYRTLSITDTLLLDQAPENTVLGRIEHNGRLAKGVVTTSTFYEIGSGLELRKEFLYIEVLPGQGSYTWIDYNGDEVKDLNEFEISAFQDQANYIRVFTPTNEYVKTFSNQFSQSLFLKPEVLWRKEKGFKKILSKFSNQLLYRADRKTNSASPEELYNPFVTEVDDEALISVSSSFRNTLFFNRTHQKFGMDYSYQSSRGKTLLTNGFDARQQEGNEVRIRWNISKKFTFQGNSELGEKQNSSDYTSGRNYDINYHSQKVSLSFQPNNKMRLSVEGLYAEKKNADAFGGEYAKILNNGLEFRYNQPKKGSVSGKFNLILNSYTGDDNTTLAYEMLDALKIGTNYTWNVIYQRSIGANLQLNLNYTGRKTPENATVHTGGVQVRALF